MACRRLRRDEFFVAVKSSLLRIVSAIPLTLLKDDGARTEEEQLAGRTTSEDGHC
jgi:hypothetical protein